MWASKFWCRRNFSLLFQINSAANELARLIQSIRSCVLHPQFLPHNIRNKGMNHGHTQIDVPTLEAQSIKHAVRTTRPLVYNGRNSPDYCVAAMTNLVEAVLLQRFGTAYRTFLKSTILRRDAGLMISKLACVSGFGESISPPLA